MAMTDPLGDMLTRIRNGQQARKDSILTPASKLRTHVLDVLQREGYIRGYTEEALCWARRACASSSNISKASRRSSIWRACRSPAAGSIRARRSCRGSATALASTIVSTPRGVLSDAEAREQNVGGEVLAEVF